MIFPVHLLCADGEHGEVDAVELIKTAPQPRLREALIYFSHALVVHLVAAVEDHHVLAQRVAQVLHACAGTCSIHF